MTASTLPIAANPLAAVTAFLRGVERPAAVFAELLCGHPAGGDAALAVAMRAFGNGAGPITDWPQRFWRLLLAVPQLRTAARARHWPAEWSFLARIGAGTRAALLLRLVAGLDEADAAAVLGVAPATYRLALHRALPHLPDGSPDAAGWRTLAETTRRTLRQMPAPRLAQLARMREAATQPRHLNRAGRSSGTAHDDIKLPPRGLRPALWVALAVCAFAFAGTFFLPTVLRGDDMPSIDATPLPAAEAPAATFDADTALLTHRDFEQLADAREDALVRDLDFYAWYAARVASQPGLDQVPLLLPDAGTPPPESTHPTPEGRHASR